MVFYHPVNGRTRGCPGAENDLVAIIRAVAEPELSIVVPSHERPLRLRWLLNALERQTLSRSLWEVVVCHDSTGSETDKLLQSHPLAASGNLRWRRSDPGSAGKKRNIAWRMARGSTIVFTDDDCRPPKSWLESVCEAARRNPGAIVQGPTEGDPAESARLRGPYPRTVSFEDVPTPWAECCNIAYPRRVLEEVGGFAEHVHSGEDTDLNLRARAAGAGYLGEPQMKTYHAIEESSVRAQIQGVKRWRDMPWLIKRQPYLREVLTLGLFWKRTHALFLLACLGLILGRRHRVFTLLAVPWSLRFDLHRGGIRGRIRHLLELPGWAIIEGAEIAVLLRGSVRHRSILL